MNKVKEHYDNHLGRFYSWMIGDFQTLVDFHKEFYLRKGIVPQSTKLAIDLGAANGVHTIALSDLGFDVFAIDSNDTLLNELHEKAGNRNIKIIYDDIKTIKNYESYKPELIVCVGDTISHLETLNEIEKLIEDSYEILIENGKLVLSFRDYTDEPSAEQRFIPVKSDKDRILTCYLDYQPDKIITSDMIYENINGEWKFSLSSYSKYRVKKQLMIDILKNTDFEVLNEETINGMCYIVCKKV
ncbi:MAG TPA: methyltransferase domain-containing protein [Ignavibacteria bacterium]|nr:methyltransferase domain-containing protein [Ignavibacteria bacterium]